MSRMAGLEMQKRLAAEARCEWCGLPLVVEIGRAAVRPSERVSGAVQISGQCGKCDGVSWSMPVQGGGG